MRFSFNVRKRLGFGRPTAEQRAVLERLERGELTAEEAGRLLGDVGREWRFSTDDGSEEPQALRRPETEDEATAREGVARRAREVDEELERKSR